MSETKEVQLLSREDILNENDIEFKRVPGFKPGQAFCIRSLTAGDMIVWSEANEGEAKRTAGLRLIVNSVVDGEPGAKLVNGIAKGQTIFTVEDLPALRRKSHRITNALVDEILSFNGMNVKAGKRAAEADAKNG